MISSSVAQMMKDVVITLLEKVGVSSSRTKNITKHVGLSLLYKGGSIIISFLLVPLTLDYLGVTDYGIWVTIASFISWFSFFDIGLGNGLRNKFTEAVAKRDDHLARGYVSATYFTIGTIGAILIFIFIITNYFINWSAILNTNEALKNSLRPLMLFVFVFFCIQLVAKLITTIYIADQKSSIQGLIGFLTQILLFLAIWILVKNTHGSLLYFGILFMGIPAILLVSFNFFSFRSTYKKYRPAIKLWKRKFITPIMGLGVNFFIIQIAGIILYSTDNIIISQLFGPQEVTPYSIAFKYFSIIAMVMNIIIMPYWSGFTEAYAVKDFKWMRKSIKNLNRISTALIIATIIMICISNKVYYLWVGDKVTVPFLVTLFMGIYFMTVLFVQPFTFFLNGTGKVRLQLIQSVVVAVLNIPLSIYLAKYLSLGIAGIILGTTLCCIPSIFLPPIQYLKIIKNKATGIWDR